MEDLMYMDGQGTSARTDALIDALWSACLPAIFGSTVAVAAPLYPILLLFSREPVSAVHWLAAIGFPAAIVVAGVMASLPWFRARRALLRHIESLERETKKHGKGWAVS
jgi:hypothetical protein